MKRKVLGFIGTLLVMTLSLTSLVGAETLQTVSLTGEDELVYTEDSSYLANAFVGMAPGDTRTVAIKVANENKHEASFFISGEVTKTLESINENAKGGAYDFDLAVGADKANAQSLLNTVAGGYDGGLVASDSGLAEITELEDYQYIAKIAKGESTYVFLTLHLDGEGFDSSTQVDYSNAVGQLEFQFRAYYGDEPEAEPVIVTEYLKKKGETNYVKKIVDQLVPLAGGVKTGDEAPIAVLTVMLILGAGLIVIAVKRRKAE